MMGNQICLVWVLLNGTYSFFFSFSLNTQDSPARFFGDQKNTYVDE